MKINDFLVNVFNEKVINDNVKIIEKRYFPFKISAEELKYLVSSLHNEPIFFEDANFYRLLALQEILDAENDMNVDFKRIGILPCIDCGDNDFIAYDFSEYCWCKFNISEEFKYSKKQTIFGFFK
jgi:hypothetical protein